MVHNIVFVQYGKKKEIALAGNDAGPDKGYVPDSPDIIAASQLAYHGDTITLTFDAPPRGNYEFVCTYPGHYDKMNGYFIVKASL